VLAARLQAAATTNNPRNIFMSQANRQMAPRVIGQEWDFLLSHSKDLAPPLLDMLPVTVLSSAPAGSQSTQASLPSQSVLMISTLKSGDPNGFSR
jgi:hypothetical protein